MTKYFKNVKSFEELKKQYKELLKKHHPDNGGDVEAMKEINVQLIDGISIFLAENTSENAAPMELDCTIFPVNPSASTIRIAKIAASAFPNVPLNAARM